MIRIIIFIIIVLFTIPSLAYNGLLFKPLTANPFEPRVGSIYQFSHEKLRLDIGTSIDLTEFNIDSNIFRIGADFFTYTRLRSQSDFKFPVETSDYFFGINSSFKGSIFNKPLSARLRIAHISSHVVDGLAVDSILTRLPFVYSREFIDLTAAINITHIRIYCGLDYIFSSKTAGPNRLIPQFGFDFTYDFNSWLKAVGGYDFKLEGIYGAYTGNNAAQLGFMLITSDNIGLLISTYIYNGKSIHGMFFQEYDSYFGMGFQLIFL